MSNKEQNAIDYVNNAEPACKSCKSFGTSLCPSFQKAVNEYNIDPEALSNQISKDQEYIELRPCDNDNHLEDLTK